MNVVVAEKPSVGRDLARFLGATRKGDGCLVGDEWTVTWAIGHLAELKTPDEYDPRLKRWTLEALPFVPERFELRPAGDGGARHQLDVVAKLCRAADRLVCATDAGREGELIFRYVLEIAGCADKAFDRLWLSSLTDDAIRDAFARIRPGTDYDDLHAAARSRSEADWIVGLNATRAYTVRYGGGGVLWSVGRVQTPVLALIARRDDEIRTFRPDTFWELRTRYRGVLFRYRAARDITPGDAPAEKNDDRFRERDAAQAMLARITGEPLRIAAIDTKRETHVPPLLYDLTQLQRDLNVRFGFSAAETLKLVQDLYEKKLVTYPRTDCRQLPTDMRDDVRKTLHALRGWNDAAIGLLAGRPLPNPKRVFDDAKVTDHHAIVPTGKLPQGLSDPEQKVFDAVATRLVQAFLPDKLQDVTTVDADVAGVGFRARGVRVVEPGWSALEPKAPARKKSKAKGAESEGDDEDAQELPAFTVGESGPHEPDLHEGSTKPPRPYTENTLLAAMETAGKFVDDEQLREAMKARGLGTPATRASILETLIARRYVFRDKKALRVTDLGRYLVAVIQDPLLKSPELTGDWEHRLKEIEGGRLARPDFMAAIVAYAKELILRGIAPPNVDGLGACPRCGASVVEGREGFGCSAWKDGCHFVLWKTYRGATLSAAMARELIGRRVLLRPLPLEGVGPRILCLTADGLVIDLEPPSRDAQRGSQRGTPARAPQLPAKPAAKGRDGPPRAARKPAAGLPPCPRCQRPMLEGDRGFGCSGWQQGCRFVVWKEIAGKTVTEALVRTLVEKRKTRLLDGFRDAAGQPAKGRLVLDGDTVRAELEANG